MPNKRDLRMEKYKISTNRYRELKYFCMQYREKKSRLRAITELSVSSMERSYEYLSVPAGRRQFYQSRRKFFNILSIKKG